MSDIITINQSDDIKIDEILQREKISNDKFNKIDEEFNSNQFRILSDTTTKVFNNTFFNNNEIIKKFINYTFNRIDIDLKLYLNYQLINNDIPPLNIEESVKFLFKGGNLYNYYFEKFKQDNPNKNYQLIEDSFSLSDNDFTLLIIADNKLRYEIIKKYSILIINNSLDKIIDTFNKIFHKNNIRNVVYEEQPIILDENIIPNRIDVIELEDLFKLTRQTAYYMFKNKSFYKKLFIDSDLDIWRIYNICSNVLFMNDWISSGNLNYINKKNANEILSVMVNLLRIKSNVIILNKDNNNLYILGIKVQIYDLLKELDNIFLDNMLLINLKKRNFKTSINNKIRKYTKIIEQSNFYTRTKLNQFKNNLIIALQNLINNKFYKLDGNIKVVYNYNNKNNININDITFENKHNIIVSLNQQNEKLEIYNINSNHNYHYKSSNFTINKSHKYQIIDFDLLRIKLNVRLSNILEKNNNKIDVNIPSEFIDISIPSFEDTTNRSTLSNYSKYISLIEYRGCLIQSYTLQYAIKDIEYVFFSQYFWAPFLADKYEKRLTRYIFFQKYFSSQINNLIKFNTIINILKNVVDNIDNNNINRIIDPNIVKSVSKYIYQNINTYNINKIYKDLDLNNILNEVTDINENNKLLIKLIKNVLLLAKVYKFNNDDLRTFIDYYNKQYKLEGELTITEYKHKVKTYIINVHNKYEQINNIFK